MVKCEECGCNDIYVDAEKNLIYCDSCKDKNEVQYAEFEGED